jgi:hypothetical protein
MGPSSLLDVLIQSSVMGFFRIVAWGHVQYFNRIVKKCLKKKNQGKKNE